MAAILMSRSGAQGVMMTEEQPRPRERGKPAWCTDEPGFVFGGGAGVTLKNEDEDFDDDDVFGNDDFEEDEDYEDDEDFLDDEEEKVEGEEEFDDDDGDDDEL